MKLVLLSAITSTALLSFFVSPSLAQVTPEEAAMQAGAPIVFPEATTVGKASAIAVPAVARARPFDSIIASHAASNGVPPEVVHRVIMRESRYRADARGRGGTTGLMQIKLATARSMGYTGSVAGLLDPDTNLTYGVRYLAGAYRAANGHPGRAIGYYASGYRGARKPASAYARMPAAPTLASADPSAEPVVVIPREVRRKHRR